MLFGFGFRMFGMFENSNVEHFYDFDLEQWDFDRKLDESINDYLNRISNSRIKNSNGTSPSTPFAILMVSYTI